MADFEWAIHAREFAHCNCSYGCPCQFDALPTHGNCKAVIGFVIDRGFHGTTALDGLKVAGIFAWPGAIHEGKGAAQIFIDRRATAQQRESLLRILTGQDTEPGATIFQVLSTVIDTLHEPVDADITFEVDQDKRHARIFVKDYIDARGEPILNPVTGEEHRARIDLPHGFEYSLAEVGRGWATAQGKINMTLADSHAHFAEMHLSGKGILH